MRWPGIQVLGISLKPATGCFESDGTSPAERVRYRYARAKAVDCGIENGAHDAMRTPGPPTISRDYWRMYFSIVQLALSGSAKVPPVNTRQKTLTRICSL